MAMQTIPQTPLFFPAPYAGGSMATFTLDSTNDWFAVLFYWPGGDLTKCAFYASSVSGSPVVTAQLFNTDPSDGGTTPVNTGSAIGSAVDSASLAAAGPFTISGIGQTSLSAGIYAMRIIFKSGTSVVIGRDINQNSLVPSPHIPFVVTVTDGGAQTRVQSNGPLLALGASSFVPVPGLFPPCSIATLSYQSTSNPDEYGLWFANPFPVSIRVCGVANHSASNSRPDIRVAFYSGSLASPTQDLAITFDRDLAGSTANAGGSYYPFSTKQTVAAGAEVGIGLRSTTAHNQSVWAWDFLTGNEAIMDAWWGQSATLFTREADTGALTETTYRTPLIFPIIDGVDSGGGGGAPVPCSRPIIAAW